MAQQKTNEVESFPNRSMNSGSSIVSKKEKKKNWSPEEVIMLLKIWQENAKELNMLKRNAHVYDKIANVLRDKGVDATAMEVHFKINNLKQRFRKEEMLSEPSTWKYFKQVKLIFEKCKYLDISSQQKKNKNSSKNPMVELQKMPLEIKLDNDSSSPGVMQCSSQLESTFSPFDTFNSSPTLTGCPTDSNDNGNNDNNENDNNDTDRKPIKGKKTSFRKKLLNELKRANDIAERDVAASERTIQQNSDVNREWFKLIKQFMDRSLSILESKLDVHKNGFNKRYSF